MEGGFRRNRQSGSSALECGRLKVWLIGLLRKGILFTGLEPRNGAIKGFRSKASSPDRLFRVGAGWFLVACDTVSQGERDGVRGTEEEIG
jgi:hypothetical protein